MGTYYSSSFSEYICPSCGDFWDGYVCDNCSHVSKEYVRSGHKKNKTNRRKKGEGQDNISLT